jgi:HEPN domain-containing protein
VHHAVDFPKTHDLEALFGMVPNSSGLKLEIADLNLLSSYAVEGRYPGDWELPTREEADAALEIARKARDAVRKCLPADSLA